jgi:capsular polysaccharide biosynthesis protein/SAM-dependent methyltransferase
MVELYSDGLGWTAIVWASTPEPASEGSGLLAAASEPTLIELYRNRVDAAQDGALDVDLELPVLDQGDCSGSDTGAQAEDAEGQRRRGGYRSLRRAEEAAVVDLQAVLDRCPAGNVAVLVDDRPSALTQLVSLAYPGLALREFHAETEKGRLHAELAAWARYDLILIDAANSSNHAALFRNVFSHLKPGGTFFVRTFRTTNWTSDVRPYDPHLWPVLARLMPVRGAVEEPALSWAQRDRINMADAVGRMVIDEDHLILANRVARYAKLRDVQMDAILDIRGDEIGVLLERMPSVNFTSRCVVRRNAEPLKGHRDTYSVPPLSIREYRGAVCLPFGIAVQDNLVLPETYRHNQYTRLSRTSLSSKSHFFTDVPPHEPSRRLDGPYFNLASEYPGHFGHFMSEVVSRLWGWAPAKERHSELKALLSQTRGGKMPSFVYGVLAAYGIGSNDIELYGRDEAVEVDALIGVTPMYSMPDYVHPGIADVWSTIGRNLVTEAEPAEIPERIFVLRPPGSIRPCRNEAELTERFIQAGFQTVRPETMPLADQVALFRGAKVIAGVAGSAMMNLLYCESGKRVILVGSDTYTSSNDYMIGAVRGHEIDQVLSAADIRHPPGGWSREAFFSGWSFDVEREGRLLNLVLADLDDPNPDQLAAAYTRFRNASPGAGSPLIREAKARQQKSRLERAAIQIVKPHVGPKTWARLRSLRRS